jgi:hypothetical protein
MSLLLILYLLFVDYMLLFLQLMYIEYSHYIYIAIVFNSLYILYITWKWVYQHERIGVSRYIDD